MDLFNEPLIFWNIFKFMSVFQTIACKRVCKLWKERIEHHNGIKNSCWVFQNIQQFIDGNKAYYKLSKLDSTHEIPVIYFDAKLDKEPVSIIYWGSNMFGVTYKDPNDQNSQCDYLVSFKNGEFLHWEIGQFGVYQIDVFLDYVALKSTINDSYAVNIYQIQNNDLMFIVSFEIKEKVIEICSHFGAFAFETQTCIYFASLSVLNADLDIDKMQKLCRGDFFWPSHKSDIWVYTYQGLEISLARFDPTSNPYQPLKTIDNFVFKLNTSCELRIFALQNFTYVIGENPKLFLYDPILKEMKTFPQYRFIGRSEMEEGVIICSNVKTGKTVLLKIDPFIPFSIIEMDDKRLSVAYNKDISRMHQFTFIGKSYACIKDKKINVLCI